MKGANFARVALLVSSLAVSFAVAECAARIIHPVDTGSSFNYRVPHPTLGWSLEPHASYTNRLPEEAIKVSYNSRGWRDREHALEAEDGVTRIVMLGDSFMEAYSVNFPDTVHAQLEELGARSGRRLEVLNLGVGGYGTLQEELAFMEVGRRFSPDLVLLGFFADNDVADNSLELESLRLADGLKVESRPFLDPEASEWRVMTTNYEGARAHYERARAARSWGPRRFLRERSVLLRLAWTGIKQWRSPFPPSGHSELNEDLETALVGIHMCDEHPAITRGWALTRRILARMNAEVTDAGAQLVVFNVPAWHEVDPEAMQQVRDALPHADLCLEQPQAQRRFRAMLDDLGIPLIDLLPRLVETVRTEGTPAYRVSDQHWNPVGHEVAAGVIFERLDEMGMLDE